MTSRQSGPGPVTEREVETIRAGYELWNDGDVAGLMELCFSDDIEYRNAPEWPGQRVYRGADSVGRFLREEVAEVIGLRPVEVVRADVFANELLLELRVHTHGSLSGLDLQQVRLFHVARIEGGKVSRVRVYLDEQEATRAAKTGAD